MKIEKGLKFKLNKRNWTITGFRGGLALITYEKTGQTQRVTDEDLLKLIRAKT